MLKINDGIYLPSEGRNVRHEDLRCQREDKQPRREPVPQNGRSKAALAGKSLRASLI